MARACIFDMPAFADAHLPACRSPERARGGRVGDDGNPEHEAFRSEVSNFFANAVSEEVRRKLLDGWAGVPIAAR
jgi:hypothetical protein